MILIDRNLAQRIEGLDVLGGIQCVQGIAQLRPTLGAEVLEIAGGCAGFAGLDTPLTRAVGIGMGGPVSPTELDQVEAVAFDHGADSILEVSPFVDPSLLELLGDRDYRPSEMVNVLFRPLSNALVPQLEPGVVIERVTPENQEAFVATISEGFFGSPDVPESFSDVARVCLSSRDAVAYLIRVDGVPAGGGNLFRANGLAGLFGSAILPPFRKRGLHTALVRFRLAEAARLGCDLATIAATPGSGSHRNVERLGFQVAYTRVVYTRKFPKQN